MDEWIKVEDIGIFYNLIEAQYAIDSTKKYWDEILKNENITYRYSFREDLEYINGGKYRGSTRRIYIMELYVNKESLVKIKEILQELEKEEELVDLPWELQEDEK